MRSVAFSMAGVSVFGLGLSALIAFVAAADDVKNVQVGGKTYQARTVNGRTFLTRGIEELKTRQLEAPLPVEDSSDRQTIEWSIELRRAERKETANKLKEEIERLTREGKSEAAAQVTQDLKSNSLEGRIENLDAFISEHFQDHERLLERIDALEKRVK